MTTSQHYDDEQLACLVFGDESSNEFRAVAQHVEDSRIVSQPPRYHDGVVGV